MLAIFGGLFVALFAIVGIAVGIGHPSVPSGAVAVVEDAPDGTVTQQDFDDAFAADRRESGPAKATRRRRARSTRPCTTRRCPTSCTAHWVRGEAAERGITVSDTEISNQLQQIIQQQFGGQKKFQQFLKQAGYTAPQARDQVELIADQRPDQAAGHPVDRDAFRTRRSPTTTRPTSRSSANPRRATCARSSTRTRRRWSRPRRSWPRTTRPRAGSRSPRSTRPTRPPRRPAAFAPG